MVRCNADFRIQSPFVGMEFTRRLVTGRAMAISTPNREILMRADIESAPTCVPRIIQSFKRHSTIEYIRMVKGGILPPFDGRVWQRGYWDRIIRSEKELEKLSEYISNNPLNWAKDKLNGGVGNFIMEPAIEYKYL